MNDRFYTLIGKYALLLTILYFISYAFLIAIDRYEFESDFTTTALIRSLVPLILDVILNVVAALFVQRDINKYNVRTRYVLLATVLYRPLGIVAFLLFVILQNTEVKQQNS